MVPAQCDITLFGLLIINEQSIVFVSILQKEAEQDINMMIWWQFLNSGPVILFPLSEL